MEIVKIFNQQQIKLILINYFFNFEVYIFLEIIKKMLVNTY